MGMIGLLVLALVVVLLVVASRKPDTFRVERSIETAAAPEAVFALLNDFRNWPSWSPWEKLDPAMRRTYTGPEAGVGSAYAWEGNRKAGAGRMEIIESIPPSRVALSLEFTRPFPAQNTTAFTVTPTAGGSRIVWEMQGKNTYMGKVMSVFTDMDRMVGPDFEAGLRNLKAAAESGQAGSAEVPPAPVGA